MFQSATDMKRQVLNYLRSHCLYLLTAEKVAARLQISVSTMRVHLRKEGTGYTELRNQVRREKVGDNPERNGKWLAYELGFTQLHSFYRWFGSTYGETFSEWKAA